MRTRFEIVWQTSPGEAPVVLRSVADPNDATMAFHEELTRLRRQEATGELFMRNSAHARHPLLRQPLKNYRARHPLVRPPLKNRAR